MTSHALVGTWKLASLEFRTADGAVTYPFGTDVVGLLVYTPEGYMSAQIMAPNRPNFATADTLLATVEEKAAAQDTYVAYCGRYEVAGNKVIHHVEMSLLPNWTGGKQERFWELNGDTLRLSTPPMMQRGKMQSSHLILAKVGAPGRASAIA
jgi:hypothetical protein